MKTKIIIFLLIVVITFVGCKIQQKAVENNQVFEKIPETSTDSLIIWEQNLLSGIKVKDSIYFYNNVEIKLEKKLNDKQKFVKNHAIVSIDSTLKIFDRIPTRTAGLLKTEAIRGEGGINILPVSFKVNGSLINLFFIRKGSLSQKIKIYKDQSGKIIKKEYPAPLKDGEICTVDSTKVNIEYNKNKYDARFISGTTSTVLVVNKEYKVEKEVNRDAQNWGDKN